MGRSGRATPSFRWDTPSRADSSSPSSGNPGATIAGTRRPAQPDSSGHVAILLVRTSRVIIDRLIDVTGLL
ncbi:MAG: hypothetical protein QOJ06_2973 [Pseudonocardiales bacterium]|jgi:hypothetical protein|nr:hypothetical protein [Pseudonocardiales bacterium]